MLFLYIARFTIMVQFTVNLLGVISNLLGDSVSNKIITTFIISCHMDISQNINSHVVMGHGSNSLYLEIMVLHDCINGIAVGRNVLFIKIRKKFLPSLKILSWAKAAIRCLRALLSTLRINLWWSKNATRGDNADTSVFNLHYKIKWKFFSIYL